MRHIGLLDGIQCSKTGSEEPGVDAREENRHSHAVRSNKIARRAVSADHESLESQPAQIVGHASGGVLLTCDTQQVKHTSAQIGIAESIGQMEEQGEWRQE